jgi:peptide/nickel transport system permease protein
MTEFRGAAAGAPRPPGASAADGSVAVPLPRPLLAAYRVRPPISRRYLISRLVNAVLTVWGVITIVFFAMHLTGDPAALLVAANATPQQLAAITKQMGFDQSPLSQYFTFISQVVTGHYPLSIVYDAQPLQIVLQRLPATLVLGGTGLAGGIVVGLLAGFIAAVGRFPKVRWIPVSVLTAFEGIPSFFLGVVLIALFAITLPLLPLSGDQPPVAIILPALVIVLALAAPIARVFRTSLIETRNADHVRLAESKGLSPTWVLLRHVVINSLGPVVNVLGVQAGVVFGGEVVTETVFSWPGVGQLTVSALGNRDYPVVLAAVTVLAVGFVIANLLVDVLAAALDPRGGHR